MKEQEAKIKKTILKQCKVIDLLTQNNTIKINSFPVVIKRTKEPNYSALCHKNKIELFIPLKMTDQQTKELPIILLHEYFHLCIDQSPSLTLIMKSLIDKNKDFFVKLSSSRLDA